MLRKQITFDFLGFGLDWGILSFFPSGNGAAGFGGFVGRWVINVSLGQKSFSKVFISFEVEVNSEI